MRSALLDVNGVTRVQVMLREQTAVVTYDSRVVEVDALVNAISGAMGPFGPYSATVTGAPRPATSGQ